ncbi:MAG: antibiotic biosynthesis monooxygenase family protein [Pseudomonadales bacterium]
MESLTPPYYAVVFRSELRDSAEGYAEAAAQMEALAETQPGYLGIETLRSGNQGVSISYWQDTDAIRSWKAHSEHLMAQQSGRQRWYRWYRVEIAHVERSYDFGEF